MPGQIQPTSRWTAFAPLLCAVHCALTPFLVMAMPTLFATTKVDWGFLAVTVVLSGSPVVAGLRKHRRILPAALIGGGCLLWAVSLLRIVQSVPENLSTPIAAMAVALGLLWNARLPGAIVMSDCTCSACRVEDTITLAGAGDPRGASDAA